MGYQSCIRPNPKKNKNLFLTYLNRFTLNQSKKRISIRSRPKQDTRLSENLGWALRSAVYMMNSIPFQNRSTKTTNLPSLNQNAVLAAKVWMVRNSGRVATSGANTSDYVSNAINVLKTIQWGYNMGCLVSMMVQWLVRDVANITRVARLRGVTLDAFPVNTMFAELAFLIRLYQSDITKKS